MVTRAADYALRATLALAALPPGARRCLTELAADCDVPPAYLYKVLHALARRGLLTPHRGITGGYELSSAARDASVLDVVEAVNGLPGLNACVLTGGCHRSPTCPAHPVWSQAQARVREVLAGARIADLAGAAPTLPQTGPRPARVMRSSTTVRARCATERGAGRPGSETWRSRGRYPNRMEDR